MWRVNGISSAQQQFFLFAVVLILLAAPRQRRSWIFRFAFRVLLVAFVFTAPQWILATTLAHGTLEQYSPLLHWEYAQSAGLLSAVRILDYIGHYDNRFIGEQERALLWALPVLAGVSLFFLERTRERLLLGGMVAIGILASSGLRGPLAMPLTFLFSSSASGIIRELYDFQALTVLGYAASISLLFSRRLPLRGLQPIIWFFALAVIPSSFTVAAKAAGGLPRISLSSQGERAITALAHAPGSFRYTTSPAAAAMSLDNRETGLSPFSLQIARHPSAIVGVNESPAAILYTSKEPLAEQAAMAALAVGAVIDVPGIASALNYEPRLRGMFVPHRRLLRKIWDVH